MYKPSPRWRMKRTPSKNEPPQQGLDHGRTRTTPQKRPPGPTKKESIQKPPRNHHGPATTPKRGYLASIFGTLLSSQGSNAHRLQPSGSRSGQLHCTARCSVPLVLVSPPYLTRVEGTGTGQASACPVRSVPCGGGRGPTLADPEGRLTAPIGVDNPRDRTRCCEVGHPRDRPPRGVRSSLAG
jgi:hypothetical protein